MNKATKREHVILSTLISGPRRIRPVLGGIAGLCSCSNFSIWESFAVFSRMPMLICNMTRVLKVPLLLRPCRRVLSFILSLTGVRCQLFVALICISLKITDIGPFSCSFILFFSHLDMFFWEMSIQTLWPTLSIRLFFSLLSGLTIIPSLMHDCKYFLTVCSFSSLDCSLCGAGCSLDGCNLLVCVLKSFFIYLLVYHFILLSVCYL